MSACVSKLANLQLYVCRLLVRTATNQDKTNSECIKLFGDLLNTHHFRALFPQNSVRQGGISITADAQVAMLVLERAKDLTRRGVFKARCDERVRMVAKAVKDLCENEVGDVSLAGFDAVSRLADIEKKQNRANMEDFPQELSRTKLARINVEGLDGMNTISHIVSGGQLQVLLR